MWYITLLFLQCLIYHICLFLYHLRLCECIYIVLSWVVYTFIRYHCSDVNRSFLSLNVMPCINVGHSKQYFTSFNHTIWLIGNIIFAVCDIDNNPLIALDSDYVLFRMTGEFLIVAFTWLATLTNQHLKIFNMHQPTESIVHTTAFVTPVVEHWLEWEICCLLH